MNKGLIYLGVFVGGTIGSYIPVLFHQDYFSPLSIICGGIGSLIGIWAAVKMSS
jgi:hypothetical protein